MKQNGPVIADNAKLTWYNVENVEMLNPQERRSNTITCFTYRKPSFLEILLENKHSSMPMLLNRAWHNTYVFWYFSALIPWTCFGFVSVAMGVRKLGSILLSANKNPFLVLFSLKMEFTTSNSQGVLESNAVGTQNGIARLQVHICIGHKVWFITCLNQSLVSIKLYILVKQQLKKLAKQLFEKENVISLRCWRKYYWDGPSFKFIHLYSLSNFQRWWFCSHRKNHMLLIRTNVFFMGRQK